MEKKFFCHSRPCLHVYRTHLQSLHYFRTLYSISRRYNHLKNCKFFWKMWHVVKPKDILFYLLAKKLSFVLTYKLIIKVISLLWLQSLKTLRFNTCITSFFARMKQMIFTRKDSFIAVFIPIGTLQSVWIGF